MAKLSGVFKGSKEISDNLEQSMENSPKDKTCVTGTSVEKGKLNILMGITLSEVGGAQRILYSIISGLTEEKYKITLVTSPGGELIDWIYKLNEERSDKIEVVTLPQISRDISALRDIKTLMYLYKLMSRNKYDIAHFHSSKMGILGRISARLAGIKRIFFTVHGWGVNDYQSRLKRIVFSLAEKLAGKCCTKVVCVSDYDRDKGLVRRLINEKKVCVIKNGIDGFKTVKGKLRHELGIPENVLVIGMVARLREPKEPFFIVRVFKEIRSRGYNAGLVIIGDGPMRSECESLCSELGIGEDVYFLGNRNDVEELIGDIDIFTLFSRWEGLPVTIIEAMSAGKPVIASKVGGIPELVSHGVNGYLVDNFKLEDSVAYMERLLTDEKLIEKMGLQGRAIMKSQFTKEHMVSQYKKLYLSDNPASETDSSF